MSRTHPTDDNSSQISEGIALNLGCGEDIRNGWINIDKYPSTDKVKEYDLEDTPWPWDDETVSKILMDNVFEHIHPKNRTSVIEECYRVLKPNGQFIMRLPVPEVGVGWDETHYAIPSWRWPYHPRWEDKWNVEDITVSKVGPGRFIPEKIALFCTRFWIARCIDSASVVVKKVE